MTRNTMIEALCDYFGVDYPDETYDDGNYIIPNTYDWHSGCSFGRDGKWLTLSDIVYALEDYCVEEED